MPTDSPSPVPPRDLEGCVRLLDDVIRWIAPHDESSNADAALASRLRAFLSDELPGLRADLAREREAAEDLFEERGRLREALFLIVAECGDSDEWTSECDVVLRRAFLPLGHYRAARSVLPPDREPAKHGK